MTDSPGFTTYAGLIDALRMRINDLRLRRLEVDELAGFQSGYTGKLFSSADADNYRRLTKFGLPRLLGALDCELVLRPKKRPKRTCAPLTSNHHMDQALADAHFKKLMVERGKKGGVNAWRKVPKPERSAAMSKLARRRRKTALATHRRRREKRRAKAKAHDQRANA